MFFQKKRRKGTRKLILSIPTYWPEDVSLSPSVEHATKSPPPVLTIFEAIVKCTMELRNISWGHTYRDNQVHMYDGIISQPGQYHTCPDIPVFGESGGTCTHWLGNTLNTMGEILHYNLIGWLHIQNNINITHSMIIINRVNQQKLFNTIN